MRKKNFWFMLSGTLAVLATALMSPKGAVAASTYKVLYKFTGGADGKNPDDGLIFDTAGNLYGTTIWGGNVSCNNGSGCGTAFKLTRNSDGSWTESVLYSFCSLKNCNDGSFPVAPLIFDTAGNLYGTTLDGGNVSCNCGTVFKLTQNSDGGWTETVLHRFNFNDGSVPLSLIFDVFGNLYGTTAAGGSSLCFHGGCGVVFKLTPQSGGRWMERVLYTFTGGVDGEEPVGLIFDTAGNLYGTTALAGNASCGCGTVFKLTPNSNGTWTENVLHSFTGRDGAEPNGGLIFDTTGNLYGTTFGGGNDDSCNNGTGCGTVFKLTPNSDGSWKYHKLHDFSANPGAIPPSGLVPDSAGNLYGTTESGRPGVDGVVFKLTPQSGGGWAYSVLHLFSGNPAASPSGGLAVDKGGNLYGTTSGCGSGYNCHGVVFELTP
jgi:uncharacterized repeat protein (TIGR03803 family)